MRALRKLLFFLFDLRQCFKCGLISGDWDLLDNTYPHADSTDYLHICKPCNNKRRGIKEHQQ